MQVKVKRPGGDWYTTAFYECFGLLGDVSAIRSSSPATWVQGDDRRPGAGPVDNVRGLIMASGRAMFAGVKALPPLCLALVTLVGCATGPQYTDAERAAILAPVTCPTRPQCDLVWSRMQAWVATNSKWRIQLANEVAIQTYGPSMAGNSSTDTAYSLVRTERGDGGATISIRAACANPFGCFPDPIDAIKSLKAAVGI